MCVMSTPELSKRFACSKISRMPENGTLPILSDTMAEVFMPDFEASTWGMVIAPPNLPAPLLAKLNADCVAALRRPEVVERHRVLGAEIATSEPDEARRFCEAEMRKWGDAARKAGIQPQ